MVMRFKSAFQKHVLVSINLKCLRWHTCPKFRYTGRSRASLIFSLRILDKQCACKPGCFSLCVLHIRYARVLRCFIRVFRIGSVGRRKQLAIFFKNGNSSFSFNHDKNICCFYMQLFTFRLRPSV